MTSPRRLSSLNKHKKNDSTWQPRNRAAANVVHTAKSQRRVSSYNHKSRRNRKYSSHRPFWRRIPLWAWLTGAALVIALYLFLFYYFFVNPFSFRWKAIYGEPDYPEGYDIRGIDISHYQDRMDWSRLRNASIQGQPLRFVFIKATEGVSIIDENLNENIYQARQNDLICGAYHFFTPDVEAGRQARFFLKQVHLEAGDLPPVLDIEKAGALSKSQLQKAAKTWLDIVEEHYGVKPIIYTGYRFKLEYLNDTIFNSYPYWIAHYYVDRLEYKGPWAFWQYTDVGHIDGIKGYVDFNIFNGSFEQLHALTIKPEEIDRVGL